MTFQLRDPEMRGNYGSSGEERVGLESFLKSQCQSSIWPSKPEQNSKWTDLKYQLRGKTIGLFSMPKVRALRAGFWEQLKATIKRNVLRKMRNKRHTIRVNRHLYQFCQFPISGGGGSHLLHGHHHYLEAHPEKSVHGSCLGSAWSFKCDIYNASARVKTPNNQRIFLHSPRTIIMMPWFRKEIVYAPDDPTITNLMQKVEKALGPAAASFTGVADEGEILKRYEADFSTVYMGIVFNITNGNKDLRYTIHMTNPIGESGSNTKGTRSAWLRTTLGSTSRCRDPTQGSERSLAGNREATNPLRSEFCLANLPVKLLLLF